MPNSRSAAEQAVTQTPLAYAYSLLARRDYSEARLTEKMQAKGFTPRGVADTVATLKRRDHLDDGRLAAALAERFVEQGFGPAGVRAKLGQRGLHDDAIERALTANGERTPHEAARRLVETRYSPDVLANQRTYARAYRLLIRRGYASETAAQVLEECRGSAADVWDPVGGDPPM